MARGKLCVNLVCKNESAVIERCLRSVMPLIDSWCIVDTGSTDDTKDIIRSVMKKLPGRLYEQKWVNFGHNKTAALRLARKHAKYALLMDADDTIVIEQEGLKLDLDAQVYNLRVRYSDLEYDRPHIVATDPDFKYVGVRHEYLHAIFPPDGGRLEGLRYQVVGGGARSRNPKQKFLDDAAALMDDFKTDPDNVRTAYYIGQSFKDAGGEALKEALDAGESVEDAVAKRRVHLEEAVVWFRKRGQMPGFPEEAFIAMLEAAKAIENLGRPPEQVIHAYLEAWEYRPYRAEPLCELARYLRCVPNWYSTALQMAKIAMSIPRPQDDVLFVQHQVYSWRSMFEYAVAAFYVGKRDEGAEINRQLLERDDLPPHDRKQIEANLHWCLHGVGPPEPESPVEACASPSNPLLPKP